MLSRSVLPTIIAVLWAVNSFAGIMSQAEDLRNGPLREALFSAHRGEWFDAIVRLQGGPPLGGRTDSGNVAALSERSEISATALVEFELGYRLHRRDGRPAGDYIDSNIAGLERNELFFRLAKVYLQKGMPDQALLALNRIAGDVLPESAHDLLFFRAQVLMEVGRYSDAVVLLDGLRAGKKLPGFAGYNLGVAYLLSGNEQEGRRQLDLAGQIRSVDEMSHAIRDKANLALGEQLLGDGRYEEAEEVLDRVRLDGPYSARALLFSGWAAVLQQDCKKALVPWTLLSERDVTDAAVQDAILAVPYCYGKLGIHNNAAVLYGRAVEAYEAEIDRLNRSLASIREGRFLDALERNELQEDANWVVRLRELPEMPETYYLRDLMASHRFQESMHNYVDLEGLRKRLGRWEQDLAAYEELVEKRRAHYEPLLPVIDAEFDRLDARMRQRLRQRDDIGRQLEAVRTAPRQDLLSTSAERALLKEIDRVDRLLRPYHTVKTLSRIERLRGLVNWSVYAGYDQRLLSVTLNFGRLEDVVDKMMRQYDRYLFFRQAAVESYSGYDALLKSLRNRIGKVSEAVGSALARQGERIEEMAETELVRRREVLEQMQVRALYAMADSYDRAAVDHEPGRRGGE